MTEEQITAIKCAYADLVGALQARNQRDSNLHDWASHRETIIELEERFPFIEPVEDLNERTYVVRTFNK